MVDEDRIKLLCCFELGEDPSDEGIRRQVIELMGRELARRLVEFEKVLISVRKYPGMTVFGYYGQVEVIVPDAPKV